MAAGFDTSELYEIEIGVSIFMYRIVILIVTIVYDYRAGSLPIFLKSENPICQRRMSWWLT